MLGVGVIAVTIIIGKFFLGGKRKPAGPPKALKDPETKFPFELVDKEVRMYRPVCFVFERARAPRHFLFGKGHPMRKW